jgi:hemerythrin-like domain-containing protein
MAQDAIALLKSDHRELKQLFGQLESASESKQRMESLRDRIVEKLSVHAAIEERVLYPVLIETMPDLEENVLEAMQEHALAEQLLAQVAAMSPDDRWFFPKISVLAENVRHHIDEEEEVIFAWMRERYTRQELREMGETLEEERKSAPTVPPPAAQARALLESVTGRAQELLHRIHVGAA